ncbi:MAG: 50S ribosomal protein L3 N(5)-glutamine methyltransferase [Pseudomonadota bacterium]
MTTLSDVINQIAERFERADLFYGHGTENAWDEAVYLVTQVLGVEDDRSLLAAPVDPGDVVRLLDLAQVRIQTRKPLPHILGSARYLGLDFAVAEGVMIPRSPIGGALADGQMDRWLPSSVAHVLDLCAGTGCLGIVAAHVFGAAKVDLLEIDSQAIALCQQNILAHGLVERVQVIEGDVFAESFGAAAQLVDKYDLILANPPYVSESQMGLLPEEYRFEPEAGLASGKQGLAHMEAILAQLPRYLTADGLFVGEVGATQPTFQAQLPGLNATWLDLPYGGEGVFLLEGQDISSHTARQST